MVYIVKQPLDQEEDQTSQTGQPHQKMLGTSQSATFGSNQTTSSTRPMASTAIQSPSKSGSFVNLQNYLDTNRNQATGLGTNVAKSINERGEAAKTAVDTAKTSFGANVASNTQSLNQDLLDKAVAAPTTFNQNDSDRESWEKMLSGTYTGPTVTTATSTWQPASSAVNKAVETGKLVETAGGQQELLRQIAPNPYSRGAMSLNQMLLQNVEPAREQVVAESEKVKPMGELLTSALAGANTQVSEAQKQAGRVREDLINKVAGEGGALQGYVSEIDKKAQAARDTEKANLAILDDIVEGRTPITAINDSIRATLARIGVSENQVNEMAQANAQVKGYRQADLKGINAEDYLPTNLDSTIMRGDVATAEDLARYRALNSLIGNQGRDIELTYGEKVKSDGYEKAKLDLDRQIGAYKQRVSDAQKAAADLEKQNRTALAERGWKPGSGGPSDYAGYTNSYTRQTLGAFAASHGVNLGDLGKAAATAIANTAIGKAVSAVNPAFGLALSIAGLFGLTPMAVVDKISAMLGFTGPDTGQIGTTESTESVGRTGYYAGVMDAIFGDVSFDATTMAQARDAMDAQAAENDANRGDTSSPSSGGWGGFGSGDTSYGGGTGDEGSGEGSNTGGTGSGPGANGGEDGGASDGNSW